MRRRDFFKFSASLLAGGAGACTPGRRGIRAYSWSDLRLRLPRSPSPILQAVALDASQLFERAIGSSVTVYESTVETTEVSPFDVVLEVQPAVASEGLEGGFRISLDEQGTLRIAAPTVEGVRNGVYAFMESQGFRFFRDGESIPVLSGEVRFSSGLDVSDAPRFALRGDMIWDNYLGPKRLCAAMWGAAEWERALLYMARNRMNLLEFYPPLEHVLSLSFPEISNLSEGRVLPRLDKHRLMQRVLARGRSLGIRFMYVLTYGAFPEPIRLAYPHLEWRNGYLCAHQPELAELTARVWSTLIEELGTDHLFAIRHRGEEEQVYSDPCRSVTKADGFRQAFSVLRGIDPEAEVTVWTWGERLPDLFEGFPDNVLAAHVRHGMADVFGERGEGREQRGAAPDLPAERGWLSSQFTVFSATETSIQTAWSDSDALTRDAREAALAPSNRGYLQWPEWTDTSPWLADVIARLSWNPERTESLEEALAAYADARHGASARAFLNALSPILALGNARFMKPPWKRLVVPYFLSEPELAAMADVRAALPEMASRLDSEGPLFHRDFVDIALWLATRQVQAFEADAYLAHVRKETTGTSESIRGAILGWDAIQSLLSEMPELSLFETARSIQASGELAPDFVSRFWDLGFAFYNGYPLVVSPESVALVFRRQTLSLEGAIAAAASESTTARLDEPGWFWHDFPEPAWADSVRALPSFDPEAIEIEFEERLVAALGRESESATSVSPTQENPLGSPSDVSSVNPRFARLALRGLLDPKLPVALTGPPEDVPPPA